MKELAVRKTPEEIRRQRDEYKSPYLKKLKIMTRHRCLHCDQIFPSENISHRLCKTCSRRAGTMNHD